MGRKKNSASRFYYSLKISICFGLATLAVKEMPAADGIVAYAEEKEYDVFYVGVADGKVNVRVAPGQDNAQVMYNGEKVQLKANDKVTIIGEDMVGDKVWYKVRFTRGEQEDEIVGYCTSSYITKTSTTITPTPTPSPTPTPTPTPTLTPTPTVEAADKPSAAPTGEPDEEKGGKLSGGVIAAIIVAVVAGAGLIFLKIKQTQAAGKAASHKMAQLKKMKLKGGEEDEEDDDRGRRRPEVKTKSNYRETQADQVYQDVYVKNPVYSDDEDADTPYSYISQASTEAVKENAAKENEERRALREEIEELRQHDLVIHKYFGKGEVYDNSDVRLIEVRFGGDVRFMNKDALAAKKLMKKCSDDTMHYYHRNGDRQN